MIQIKAENERNSGAIAEFFKASAPAHAPYLRPAGNADMDYFGLKLVVHVLIGGSLS